VPTETKPNDDKEKQCTSEEHLCHGTGDHRTLKQCCRLDKNCTTENAGVPECEK